MPWGDCMTTRRTFSAQEKMEILNEGMLPGASAVEVCRKHGMREAVSGPSKEVVALKQENARLKKLVADEALVINRLRELNETLAREKTMEGGRGSHDRGR